MTVRTASLIEYCVPTWPSEKLRMAFTFAAESPFAQTKRVSDAFIVEYPALPYASLKRLMGCLQFLHQILLDRCFEKATL